MMIKILADFQISISTPLRMGKAWKENYVFLPDNCKNCKMRLRKLNISKNDKQLMNL